MKNTILELLEKITAKAMADAGIDIKCKPLLSKATKKEFGDYQANGVLSAAKRQKMNPRDLAEKVVANIDNAEVIEKVEIAGPGFINYYLQQDWLSSRLNQLDCQVEKMITLNQKQEVIVVDYSGPNLAKEMHVGHLRSTIIGDCLARVFSKLNYKVIRQNHVGDWGTQFGMLLTYMTDLERKGAGVKTKLSDLEEFYREAKKKFDEDSDFAHRARDQVVKLQAGDAKCMEQWQTFIGISLKHCFAVYARLNVLMTKDDLKPESSYNLELKGVISSLKDKNLLKESEGAQCVFLEQFIGKDKEPLPIIVQKSDGGFLYATTDLAALQYRSLELKASKILYVVDIRQGLHFDQIFSLAKTASFVSDECELQHISFGTMLGKDGKPFKTRTGGTVKLNALLDEAITRAAKIIAEKNPDFDVDKVNKIAQVIGINAVKYADLSKNRKTNYIFEWDQMLALEGNTAPYMMYAYSRIQSILREAGESTTASTIIVSTAEERRLALKILQFPEMLTIVVRDYMPHHICQFIFELAGCYMSFYEKCPVLSAQESIRESRLGLCKATANTIKLGFDLLGLKVLEKM